MKTASSIALFFETVGCFFVIGLLCIALGVGVFVVVLVGVVVVVCVDVVVVVGGGVVVVGVVVDVVGGGVGIVGVVGFDVVVGVAVGVVVGVVVGLVGFGVGDDVVFVDGSVVFGVFVVGCDVVVFVDAVVG